jgi:cytochrome c peroxidase
VTGAIMQHFTKTMNRVTGTDFRLPTQAEADAVEAFQLFIGRSHEVDTTALGFVDATATRGQQLATNQTGKCGNCHAALFGIRDFFENFNQGANARVTDLPFDDGLLQPFTGTLSPTLPTTEYMGQQLFNVVPLIEAADLHIFFHNKAVDTIEDAVTHYTTPAFANSTAALGFPDPNNPGGPNVGGFGPITLTAQQIDDIANFLRELNALENIRQVRKRVTFVEANRSTGNAAILSFAIDDAKDALTDLSQKNLNPNAQHDMATVVQAIQIALAQPDANRPAYLATASAFLDAADSALLTPTGNPNQEFIVH